MRRQHMEPPFDLYHLVRVVPLASSAQRDDLSVTLLSLEQYVDGFVLNIAAEQVIDPDRIDETMHAMWAISAHDDTGQTYSWRPRAGYGGEGGVLGTWEQRMVHNFTPALDAAATTLTLTVTMVSTLRVDADGIVRWEPDAVVDGPWEMTFALTARTGLSVEAPIELVDEGNNPCPRYLVGDLLRVVPVGQRATVGDIAITIYSLELYRNGFLAVIRTDEPRWPGSLPCNTCWAGLDDAGNVYGSRQFGGSGGGTPPDSSSWRADVGFVPAIALDAGSIDIELSETRLSEHVRDPTYPHGFRMEQRARFEGPWRFQIDLTKSNSR